MELLFENLLYDLSPPELAAVLSVMIYERHNATELSNSRFIALQKKMQAIVVNIAQLEKKCGLGEESCMSVDQNVHVGFMEIASNWCKGMTFSQVMQGCKLDEGFVVNQLLRTENLCRKLADIANEIGNPELYQKCQEVSRAMLRDIVYTPSLYLSSSPLCSTNTHTYVRKQHGCRVCFSTQYN